jgi:ankyrin repeat protein
MAQELVSAVRQDKVNIPSLTELLKTLDANTINSFVPTRGITQDQFVTVLHIAASRGNSDVINLLLTRKDINVHAITRAGNTPLHSSAYYGKFNSCKALLLVSNVIAKNSFNETAYDLAKESLVVAKVKEEENIEECQKIVDLLRVPTFVEACAAGDLALVKKMRRDDALDVNAIYDKILDGKNNFTGLQAASNNCYVDLVQYLLSLEGNKKVKLEVRNNRGFTALHFACFHSGPPLTTPESISSKGPKKSVEELQQEHNSNLAAFLSKQPLPASEMDEQARRVAIADMLLREGAEINVKGSDIPYTPLHLAAYHNQLSLVMLLILRGADLTIPIGAKGPMPLLEFVDKRFPEIHQFLSDVIAGTYKPREAEKIATTIVFQGSRPYRLSFLPPPPVKQPEPPPKQSYTEPASRHDGGDKPDLSHRI